MIIQRIQKILQTAKYVSCFLVVFKVCWRRRSLYWLQINYNT